MGNATAEIATAEDSFRLIRSPAVSAVVLYALAWHWQPWSVSSDRRGERERETARAGYLDRMWQQQGESQEINRGSHIQGVYIPPMNGVCVCYVLSCCW